MRLIESFLSDLSSFLPSSPSRQPKRCSFGGALTLPNANSSHIQSRNPVSQQNPVRENFPAKSVGCKSPNLHFSSNSSIFFFPLPKILDGIVGSSSTRMDFGAMVSRGDLGAPSGVRWWAMPGGKVGIFGMRCQ